MRTSASVAGARRFPVAREGESGYAMAVLLVGMSVMAIMMTVAMPTWKQLSQREKEAELVFRGEQYARAMTLFQTKAGPGVTPPSIDVLVEQRFLRKKFKDPITNDDFALLLQSTAAPQAPGQAAGQPLGGGAQRGTAAQPAGRQGGIGTQPTATPGAAATGGIMGVTSKSKEQSIRLYKGRSHYNEWQFMPVVRTLAPVAPGAGGTTGPGGQRGPQGNQPGFPGPNGGRQGGPQGGRGPNGPNTPPPQRGGQPFNPFQPGQGQGQGPGRGR